MKSITIAFLQYSTVKTQISATVMWCKCLILYRCLMISTKVIDVNFRKVSNKYIVWGYQHILGSKDFQNKLWLDIHIALLIFQTKYEKIKNSAISTDKKMLDWHTTFPEFSEQIMTAYIYEVRFASILHTHASGRRHMQK